MPATQFAFTGNNSPPLRHMQQTTDAIKTNSFTPGNIAGTCDRICAADARADPCFCPKTGVGVGNGA
jgi:hypothetical protein